MTQDINSLRLDNPATTAKLDGAARRDELAARRVAAEFEALLLTQLTASLNPSEEEGEESLFGGGTGAGVYRQLFSEQVAGAISRAGGVGMADVILGQIRPEALRAGDRGAGRETRHALAVARLVRGISATEAPAAELNAATSVNTLRITNTGQAKSPQVVTGTETKDDVFLVSEAANSDAAPTRAVTLPTGTPAPAGAPPASLAPAVRPRRVFAAPRVDNTQDAAKPADAPRSAEPTDLRMPVQGRLSSRFGIRHDPIHGHQRFHRGMDIAAPRGTPIGAAGEGTVVFAGRQKGYGNTVVIEHPDGRRTRYAHAERLFVKRGDTVEAGEVIAAVGSTGRSTGPHLHFEVVENGRRVNPLSILANDIALARR